MQSQRPVLVQQQHLKLSPQLYQSIQLMALPLVDLRQRITEELEANPALELVKDTGMVSLDESMHDSGDTDSAVFRDDVSYDTSYGSTGGYDYEARDNKHGFIEGALARPDSLQEHLIGQLRLQPITQALSQTAELMIYSLDANGFFLEPPEKVVPPHLHRYISEAKELVSHLDPIGTCVDDYRESLLVQLSIIEDVPKETATIIRSHLDLVHKRRYTELARKLRCGEDTVMRAISIIKTLNPFPGRVYSAESPRYIIPDLSIENREGELVIVMNDEVIPVLGVNTFFSELGREGKKGDKSFAKGYVKDAQWFINSIELRNQTLFKVARAIADFQREFFFRGAKYLRPLTLRDIADEIEVHETTVSRITSSKYVQTEWGIFELKYFFTNSVGGNDKNSPFSKEGVKQVIKEILTEAAGARLSDQKVADLLQKRGISIARRTVAKYRKELDIDSSYER